MFHKVGFLCLGCNNVAHGSLSNLRLFQIKSLPSLDSLKSDLYFRLLTVNCQLFAATGNRILRATVTSIKIEVHEIASVVQSVEKIAIDQDRHSEKTV